MKKIISTLFFASLLMACGKTGFNPLEATALPGTNDGQGGGGSGDSPLPSWDKVDMDGFPSSGAHKGKLVVFVDKINQSLLLVLPIPVIIPNISQITFPNLDGAYLTTYKADDGSESLAINVPLRHVIKGGAFAGNERLPNGDPLPFVPSGELPGFAIDLPQMKNYRVHVYVGTNVAAAFVELPDLHLPIGGTLPVRNSTKTKIIGAIGYVLPKAAYNGGLYLAAQIPDEMAAVIDDLIRW